MEEKTNYPYIFFEDIAYYKIGCKLCGRANWAVYSDGKNFIMKCGNCDHVIKINEMNLRREKEENGKDTPDNTGKPNKEGQ
jgi:hypothetical protein